MPVTRLASRLTVFTVAVIVLVVWRGALTGWVDHQLPAWLVV